MTYQPNPYETSETLDSREVSVGVPSPQRRIWVWLFMGCVVPLALFGLAIIGLVIWAFFNLRDMSV